VEHPWSAAYVNDVRFVRLAGLALVAGSLAASTVASADFNAGGRKKGGKPPAGAGGGTKKPPRDPGGNKPPRDPGTKVPDPDAKGPTSEALITRYTGIVLSQPGATFPLGRLAQLYRERDGNLKKLVEDFEKRASDKDAKDAWNARVALAGVLKLDGRFDDAAKAYEAAIADKPGEAQVRLALAELRKERGDRDAARAQYDAALKLVTSQIDKESTLRSLRTLTLDGKQFDDAKKYHQELVKISPSLAVRSELGRELLSRGEAARAETELAEVVKAAAGDNRALAPALLDLGRAQSAQKKTDAALDTLKKALSAAGGEGGVRGEILQVIAEVFRAKNDLASLVALLEKEGASDFPRLVLLGGLYEETGNAAKAIATYRRALGVSSKNVETRLKIVRLLQSQGELDQAIAENEKLIQAAPKNPDFVFQLCETLLQRGDRAKALALLTKLEASASHDEDVLTRVADFYERIDEKERATKIFAHLVQVSPNDPTPLVELGDRYWVAGDRKKALETWARIRTVVSSKPKALAALGDVLLDHDLVQEGLAALKEAADLEPGNIKAKKSLAAALERAATGSEQTPLRNARFDDARGLWEEVLEMAGNDRLLAREARTHLVSLWGILKQLESKSEPLRRRLADDPPDLEAGKLLAEVQIRLRKLADAEVTLGRVTEKAPGDSEAFLALERVRVMNKNLPGAIEALERLAEIEPKRAREFYQRMAQYSAELFKDDDAIRFAEKAVALSPDDADGHKKLGEMYRRRGDVDRAIAAFRLAIQKNDRLFPVYMELGELLVAKGEADEADRVYRRVLRGAPDEELVAQSGRLSMQRNLAKGTLPDLEGELLPLTLGHPGKRVYRRLLVEVYGQMAFPLIQAVRFGSEAEAKDARTKLERIGARGVKPLLDALADEQRSQAGTALEVLAFVGNKGAGPALTSFATGNADQSLRVRAMMATGVLKDPALLGRYEALVAPAGAEDAVAPGDPVTVAAAWAVARMGDRKAVPVLERMLASGAPEVRALGALGLGQSRGRSSLPKLVEAAKAPESAAVARAATAVALGDLGDARASEALLGLARAPEPLVRAAALEALGRLGDPAAVGLALEALFGGDPAEQRVALWVLSPHGKPGREALPPTVGALDLPGLVEVQLAHDVSPSARAKGLLEREALLSKTAAASVEASPERASRVADALLARVDGPSLSPFTDGLESLSPAERTAAEAAASRVRSATVPAFASLVRSPSAALRSRAIRVLEGRSEDRAVAALTEALGDQDESVLRAALAAAQHTEGVRSVPAVARLLVGAAWPIRALAAETMGTVARRGDPEAAVRALSETARKDDFAVVRSAALRSLAGLPGGAAVLADARDHDADPDVRSLAASLAK
jgi:tetratricopeptide (TPR) repeat protein/HEAT repeat protein